MHDPSHDPLDDEFERLMNRGFAFIFLTLVIVLVGSATGIFLTSKLAPSNMIERVVVYAAVVSVVVCSATGVVLSSVQVLDALRKAQELS